MKGNILAHINIPVHFSIVHISIRYTRHPRRTTAVKGDQGDHISIRYRKTFV